MVSILGGLFLDSEDGRYHYESILIKLFHYYNYY